MAQPQTFHHIQKLLQTNDHGSKFNVYHKEQGTNIPMLYLQRDFFKITLITEGAGILSYAGKPIHIDRPAIAFFDSRIPYSWQPISDDVSCYLCLFTEDYIAPSKSPGTPQGSPLFTGAISPVFFPDAATFQYLLFLFQRMLREITEDYTNKYELLKSLVHLMIHEALKMTPHDTPRDLPTAHQRIYHLFDELLERQFPIVNGAVQLRNANEFAASLGVHTNHLNKAIKKVTNKTTTAIITTRFLMEAKSMLLSSTATIAEIGYALGFEHPNNFQLFFKRQTGHTPKAFRHGQASIS